MSLNPGLERTAALPSKAPALLQGFPPTGARGAPPLSEYGIIGNNRTAVLVHSSGSLDWASFPNFDSPPLFSRLLDHRGGYFRVSPLGTRLPAVASYEEGTNILVHSFPLETGAVVTLLDFCPEVDSDRVVMSEVHRRVSVAHGSAVIRAEFAPRFGYTRAVPEVSAGPDGVLATSAEGSASLTCDPRVKIESSPGLAVLTASIEPGDAYWFIMSHGSEVVTPLRAYSPARRLQQTRQYWRSWSSSSTYLGRWSEAVDRSSLVLKLLFYRPSGGMVAAPTTSLPECIGGPRNWDYRFCWVRDAALAVRSLFRLGYTKEAVAFVYWLLEILDRDKTGLHVLYSLDGTYPPQERLLEDWEGYSGSRPVRVGNAARDHTQHDVIGYVLDVADLLDSHGGVITVDLWRQLRHLVNHAASVWPEPDRGIWEVRCEPRHYVYSKAMCWFALDRGIDLGERLGFVAPFADWKATKDAIKKDVLQRGLCADGRGLGWYYGAPGPDASLLRIPALGLLDPEHPVMEATCKRIEAELLEGPFLARYRSSDGLPGEEGFFLPCSFWLVEYYASLGRKQEARDLMDSILRMTPSLGLLPEEMDRQGHCLGNFPQAFSHLALILAATTLEGSSIAKSPKAH